MSSSQAGRRRRGPSPRSESGGGDSGRRGAAGPGGAPGTAWPTSALAAGQASATFAELGVGPELVAALSARGVKVPFPIQAATLPDALSGRDVLGRGRTGSGKTIAFALPTVAALAGGGARSQPRRPRALVLLPTRELAAQVAETVAPLAAAAKLSVTTIFGGVGQGPQVAALRGGADIVVACPGRLEDLINQGHCFLDEVMVTVLDEADHMADLGFLPAVRRILDATPGRAQRLLFSATLDNGIDVLVRRYLSDPAVHCVDDASAPPPAMTHHVLEVTAETKGAVVRELASGLGRSLLFTRTKHGAKKLARTLTAAGVPAVDLHGNLSQPARERNLAAFSSGSVRVLVATDIAARGIHVDDVALVIHVDPPTEHKAYLHRSGRTARAGSAGEVVTVMTPDQAGDVRNLARLAGIRPTVTAVVPGHARILALSGPHAALVAVAAALAARPNPPRRRAGAGPERGRQEREAPPEQAPAGRVAVRASGDGWQSVAGPARSPR